jgi:hypothetical protein
VRLGTLPAFARIWTGRTALAKKLEPERDGAEDHCRDKAESKYGGKAQLELSKSSPDATGHEEASKSDYPTGPTVHAITFTKK